MTSTGVDEGLAGYPVSDDCFDEAFTAAYPPSAGPLRERAARAELACALRLPERAAETLAGEARVLARHLPATLRALAAGVFSYRHAQALIDETADLDDADRTAVERVALGTAGTTSAARFRRHVRRLRERRDPQQLGRLPHLGGLRAGHPHQQLGVFAGDDCGGEALVALVRANSEDDEARYGRSRERG